MEERVIEHAGKDKNSHIAKHCIEKRHQSISLDDAKIINKNFKNYYKRKVSEALYIKQKKPSLNVQDNSIPLQLFT